MRLSLPRSRTIAAAALSLTLFVCAGPRLAAQTERILFDRVSVEEGLAQSAVNAILQDRHGFMWFATQEGLDRFDGYDFEVFRHDPNEPASLAQGVVLALAEDSAGHLWVGTEGSGLDRWDPRQRAATHFRNDPANPRTLSNDLIWDLLVDRDGVLWIATAGGLNRFEPATATFTRFNHNPADPDSLVGDRVNVLLEDREGNLWVGSQGGLDRFDRDRRSFEHFPFSAPPQSEGHNVRALRQDASGALWIGTGAGLHRIDPESGVSSHFQHRPTRPGSLSHDRVRAIAEDSDGTLWIGTEGGLNRWLPDSQSFVRYLHDVADETSLADNAVYALYPGRGGVLWIGHRTGGGLSKLSLSSASFPHFKPFPDDSSSITSRVVTSFAEDRDGTLWIGSFDSGLDHFDLRRGLLAHYRHDPARAGSLADDRVMSLRVDRSGQLWIGTFEAGLLTLERGADRFRRYAHGTDDGALGGRGVTCILEDRSGRLWVGTYDGGLHRLDRDRGTFIRYSHQPGNSTSLSNDTVTSLFEDSDGTLWVGTEGGGLNRFDRHTGTFTHYTSDESQIRSLSSDLVMAIHEDRRGDLWIATLGGGLNRWRPEARNAHRGVFTRYTKAEGLANDNVYGILEDDDGNLWVSSNRGISRLDPESGTVRNYDARQGLQSNEFNAGAYWRTADGTLLFGGINGFNAFDPARIHANPFPPRVLLTGYWKLNEEVDLGRPIYEVKDIELSHRDYVVSFEFAALDYTAPEKNRYAYRLDNFDEDWVELGTRRRATYTNLNPGRYKLRVKGSNSDGVWSEEETLLSLRVVPPPWRTWWAYTLYSFLAAALAYAYTRGQAKKLEREAEYSRQLEREVASRTSELARRNEQLEEANRSLEKASLTDSLTGLLNRRYVVTHIEEELALADRRHKMDGRRGKKVNPDFLFLMFDLDGLKGINDTYGHATGDKLLLAVRDLLEQICRKSDTVVRWGGDEFLIMGREANPNSARLLAERVRTAIEDHAFDLDIGAPVHLSCSLGFAFYPFFMETPEAIHWEQVLAIADRALYTAKKSGRNAWVGLLSTDKEPPEDFLVRVYDNPRALIDSGHLSVRTSLGEDSYLVWEM